MGKLVFSRVGIISSTTRAELEGKDWRLANPASGYSAGYFKENDTVLTIDTSDVLICDPATKTFKAL